MSLIDVPGFNGGLLYYVPDKKHFNVREKECDNGNMYLICHDQMEYKNEMRKSEKNRKKEVISCSGRCFMNRITGEMRLTGGHSHKDHELMYKDLISLNAMKNKCRFIAENFPLSAHKMSIREIFLMEMVKYVCLHNRLV